ncbi:hypothetical protein Tco_0979343 [Tanacetum coccineum]
MIVTTSRYVVPTGRVKVPAGRYVVPTGKVNVIVNVIVSAGRSKVIPAGRTILVLYSTTLTRSILGWTYMDSYRDEGMGDIIVGRPFCKDACIKARWFDGMITIYKGNDSVNAQDELKGILNPYQKLKGFYKEFLNLGPKYIKDDKVEEWLTCGHVSLHEME